MPLARMDNFQNLPPLFPLTSWGEEDNTGSQPATIQTNIRGGRNEKEGNGTDGTSVLMWNEHFIGYHRPCVCCFVVSVLFFLLSPFPNVKKEGNGELPAPSKEQWVAAARGSAFCHLTPPESDVRSIHAYACRRCRSDLYARCLDVFFSLCCKSRTQFRVGSGRICTRVCVCFVSLLPFRSRFS